MIFLFWLAFFCISYAYFLYPLLLMLVGDKKAKDTLYDSNIEDYFPSVTILLPVHNEANVIHKKLTNVDDLEYPRDLLNVVIVSDGSTDETVDIINQYNGDLKIQVVLIENQEGKAHALNQGLNKVNSEIVVFTDASIMLDKKALKHIVAQFQNRVVGCVSGEDHIPSSQGGEGLYGKYELFLRNKESIVDSIVGASGSFYAQRTTLVRNFEEGLAPDFLSVLNTVEAGFRAITEPKAIGIMSASKSTSKEYDRKVRTILRGMTALFSRVKLMNPFKYGWFAIFLLSHKLMRWLVPFFLIALLIINIFLLDNVFYFMTLVIQVIFYILAIGAMQNNSFLSNSIIGKLPLFFTIVNVAILKAWVLFLLGKRQEVWKPTKR